MKYPVGDASADPNVTMAPAKESVEFTVRYVVGYRTRRAQQDRLFTRILEEIAKNPDRVALAVLAYLTTGQNTSTDRDTGNQ